jgi:hypothetical protein
LKIILYSVTGIDKKLTAITDKVVAVELDLDSYREERVFLYILPIRYYNIILGMPWVTVQDACINRPRSEMKIIATSTVVQNKEAFRDLEKTIGQAVNISAASFQFLQT